MKKEMLAVGEIVKPQGIKGQVKIITYSGDNDKFAHYKKVFIAGLEYAVTSYSTLADAVIIGLSGINDRNMAENLRGQEVSILRSDAPPLPSDEYYVIDLIGANVIIGSEVIGELIDVDNYGASDIYTIRLASGKIVQVPAIEKVIVGIDANANKIFFDRQGYEETVVD